jgi:DTW domain-containing protein YfiP
MSEVSPNCERCNKPSAICVCDRVVPLETALRILVLQHPQEDDAVLGTVPLLALSLPSATVRVGLSWSSLEASLEGVLDPARIDRAKWAVLAGGKLPKAPPPLAKGQVCVLDRHGDPSPRPALDGIVVLDGTWSQAKALWWRNPWLLKLGRVVLRPAEPTLYGRLRKAPRPEWVSTLEAVADALPALGAPTEHRAQLRRLMRTMVQRARDARVQERSETASDEQP